MQEFLMIIENGKLEQVRLRDVRIFKDDENILVIEEIVELLPTAVDVAFNQVFPEMYTPETAQNLAFLDRSMIKFESFELAQIPQNFDISMFGLFLKANMIPKAFITLRLQQNIGEIFRNEFQHFCETIKLDWDPIYEAPRINLI
uniref:Uncharacterized protein n=1 Tax=Panagrolaimus superbus TaxID=310955 RepID=A0A914XVX3_9BILA